MDKSTTVFPHAGLPSINIIIFIPIVGVLAVMICCLCGLTVGILFYKRYDD